MEVGAGSMVSNDRHIADLRGDPEVEFAKALLRAAGRYVNPHWSKKELLFQLMLLQQLNEVLARTAKILAEVGRNAQRLRDDDAAFWRRQTETRSKTSTTTNLSLRRV